MTNERVWINGGIILAEEDCNTRRENCPSETLVTTVSHELA
jgi:hypothetical protein